LPNYKETEPDLSKYKEFLESDNTKCMYLGELNGDGLRHGFGVLLYPTEGAIYEGEWVSD